MELFKDFRKIEWGWKGGFSEAYCGLFFYDKNALKLSGMDKIVETVKKNDLQSIFILKAMADYNVPEREYICEHIKNYNEIVEKSLEAKKKITTKLLDEWTKYSEKREENVINSFKPELKKKVLEIMGQHISLNDKIDLLSHNILENVSVKNAIAKKDSITTENVESSIKNLIDEITPPSFEELHSINKINLDIVSFLSQLLGTEIYGSQRIKHDDYVEFIKDRQSDRNLVDGAIYLLIDNMLKESMRLRVNSSQKDKLKLLELLCGSDSLSLELDKSEVDYKKIYRIVDELILL